MVVGTALGLARALGKTRLPTPKVDSQQRLAALGANLGQAGAREGGEKASLRSKMLIPIPPKCICSESTDQELAGKFPSGVLQPRPGELGGLGAGCGLCQGAQPRPGRVPPRCSAGSNVTATAQPMELSSRASPVMQVCFPCSQRAAPRVY